MNHLKLAFVATILFCPVADALAQDCKDPRRDRQVMPVEIIDGKPTFGSNLCGGRPGTGPGDMCNAKDDRPVIHFVFAGAGANGWDFVRMELSSNGSDYGSPNLPGGALQDFKFANAEDRARGRPAVRKSGRTMIVENDNCNEVEVHYKVVVRDPSGNEVEVDPIIRNGGIGN